MVHPHAPWPPLYTERLTSQTDVTLTRIPHQIRLAGTSMHRVHHASLLPSHLSSPNVAVMQRWGILGLAGFTCGIIDPQRPPRGRNRPDRGDKETRMRMMAGITAQSVCEKQRSLVRESILEPISRGIPIP